MSGLNCDFILHDGPCSKAVIARSALLTRRVPATLYIIVDRHRVKIDPERFLLTCWRLHPGGHVVTHQAGGPRLAPAAASQLRDAIFNNRVRTSGEQQPRSVGLQEHGAALRRRGKKAARLQTAEWPPPRMTPRTGGSTHRSRCRASSRHLYRFSCTAAPCARRS